MKKILFALVVTTFAYIGNAQVGIGTDMPNESSQLEVVASDKGILIPQVALTGITDQTSISNGNVESLLVYNTTSAGDITPGYYYWSESKWNRIIVGDTQPLNPVTDFIDNGDGTFTYTNEEGTEYILDITANETLTTLVDNNDGTLTYTDEDGMSTLIPLSTIIGNYETLTFLSTDAANGTISFTDEDGTVTQLDLSALVDNLETVTSLVENADGTFTYTDENGDATILDIANLETLTGIALNADNTNIDYTDEDGIVTQLDLTALVGNLETNTTLAFDDTTNELTFTNEDDDNPVLDLTSLKLEPWNVESTTDKATSNTENIYQMGTVSIGKDAAYTGAALDVEGAVRGGANQQGTVGANSVAFGVENTASGNISAVSGGTNNTASGIISAVSGGMVNTASGYTSVISGGMNNIASGSGSTVSGGSNNMASGENSTVSGGGNNNASGYASVVSGGGKNTAFSAYEWVGGSYSTEYTPQNSMNWDSTDRLFNIGRGLAEGDRHDAFTILKNGKTGVGFDNFETTTFDQKFQVNGNARIAGLPAVTGDTSTDKMVVVDADGVLKSVEASAMEAAVPWNVQGTTDDATLNTENIYQTGSVAIGKDAAYTGAALDVEGAVRGGANQQGTVGANSVAFGEENNASGNYSVVSGGIRNTASETVAVVGGGQENTASGYGSTVTGGVFNTASGARSTVLGGQQNTALGDKSVVSGSGNVAAANNEWVGGSYGTLYTADAIGLTNRLFNIGRGTSASIRHDAFTILINGKTGVGFDNFETTTFDQKLQVNGNARIAGLPNEAGDVDTDKVVVVDTDGVLKSVKAAMPKFFYMPPVIFDTSTLGTALTKDLFQEYKDQFATTQVSSTGASNTIPTLDAQELEYHITYYDTAVFANMSIDADGVLTYDIIGTATPESFMNIVFVVK